MTSKRTGAKPMVVEGVTFHCYHTGILRYQWRSEDGQCAAGRREGRSSTFYGEQGLERLPPRFRSLKAAMKASVLKRRRLMPQATEL